jgi:hypothetical protein
MNQDFTSADITSFDELTRQVILTTPELWTEFADLPDQNLIDRTITRLVAPTRRRRWTRLHTFIAALLVSGAVVGGGFAAADLWRTEPAQPLSGMICSTPEDSGFGDLVYPPSADPVAACREAYVLLGITDFDGVPASEVTLTACITKTGVAQVFADTEDVCSLLGLAYPAKEQSTRTKKLAELQDSLIEKINAVCIDQDSALKIAQKEIERLSLTELHPFVFRPVPIGPCSVFIIDATKNDLLVVSVNSQAFGLLIQRVGSSTHLNCWSFEITERLINLVTDDLSLTPLKILKSDSPSLPNRCTRVLFFEMKKEAWLFSVPQEEIPQ